MTARAVPPLGFLSGYLKTLAKNPPTTQQEHRDAASMLLRHAADQASNRNSHDDDTHVTALTRLANTHLKMADGWPPNEDSPPNL